MTTLGTYQQEAMAKYLETQRASVISTEKGPSRPRRARRSRTQFDQEALVHLEAVFSVERYPDINLREKIADEIGVPEARVQTWFQNKRSRSRRSRDKDDEVPQGPLSSQETKCPSQTPRIPRPASKTVANSKSCRLRSAEVTDSDIEEMAVIDPDLTSDDEEGTGVARYAELVAASTRHHRGATWGSSRGTSRDTSPRASPVLGSVAVVPTSMVSSLSTPVASVSIPPYMPQMPQMPQMPYLPDFFSGFPGFPSRGFQGYGFPGPFPGFGFPSPFYGQDLSSMLSQSPMLVQSPMPQPAHMKTDMPLPERPQPAHCGSYRQVNTDVYHRQPHQADAPLNLKTGASPTSSGYDSPNSSLSLNVCD